MKILYRNGFLMLTLLICACNPAPKEAMNADLVVRFGAEPERLNPILGDDGAGAQLENLIYQSLYNFDPYTLDYIPQLAVGKPDIESFERDGKTYKKFRYTIRESAEWPDGEPIDAGDYLFTMKAIFNPEVAAASLRGYFGSVVNVAVHPNNRKQVEITTEGNYMLDEYVVSNLQILPQHIYDPEELLTMISIRSLLNPEASEELVSTNPDLTTFAAAFNSPAYNRETVVGSGPYELVRWESGQEVVLRKKINWWGDQYATENVLFEAYPQTITYRIIPDETVALNSIKDESVDIMSEITPDNFIGLKSDETVANRLSFYTPALLQYYWLPMNNRNDKLGDKEVRRALAHTMDVPFVIDELLEGLATPTHGAINPEKPYYVNELEPISLDLEKAAEILEAAGWIDSNENGIRDKVVDGARVELELNMEISGQLGQQLALILQDNADKVGFKINIESKKFSLIRQDMWEKNYDLSALRNRQAPSPTDLYQSWHTDNMGINGSNYSGFGNAVTDSIIEVIRTTPDEVERIENYKVIQRLMYDEQPGIFLAAPQATVIISNKWDSKPVRLKPGYYEPGLKIKPS